MTKVKRWRINKIDEKKADSLFQALKIHPVLCNLLIQRGIETYDQAKDFFRPQLSHLHSPWLMKDMDKAVERILKAFNVHE